MTSAGHTFDRLPNPPPLRGRRGAEPGAPPPLPRVGGRGLGWGPCLLSLLYLLAAMGALADWAFPPNLSRLASVGTEILDRNDRPLALLPAAGGVWRFRGDARHVSPVLLNLLVAVEDRRFWHHPGVDPVALARARLPACPHRPHCLRRLDARHAGRTPARAAPAHIALQADRDRARPAAGGDVSAARACWTSG